MPALARLFDLPDNPVPPGARVGTIAAADGVALRWATFPPLAPTARGTVLILQGRAEFIERWFETVRDLQVRGFAVAAFDWRGQGGSERLAKHPRMGHVRHFGTYDFDLDVVLREVVADLPAPLFLLAHSTGALVAVANAARLAGTVRRVVAVAPFLGLGDFGVPEGGARRLARFLRGIGMGRSFVPGGGATSMLTTPFAANRLTSDPARHARGATLAWDCPQVAIGSPSIGWLAGAFDTMDKVFRPDALDRWRLPTLVFACGADRVVSNDAIERFVVATRATELVTVPGARHELLQERDRYREQFWAAFDAFVPGGDPLAPPAPTPVPQPVPQPVQEPTVVPAPAFEAEAETEAETPPVAPLAAEPALEATGDPEPVADPAPVAEPEIAPEPAAPEASVAEGEQAQHGVVDAGVAGGDDAPALGGAAAGPGGDGAAGPLDDRDQRDDVVGLEPGLDHHVDETGGDHAIGVTIDPVPRQSNP